jgi:hypothetical protein
MFKGLMEGFCWNDVTWSDGMSAPEKYRLITDWAGRARGRNPDAFDRLTEWILDDSQWGEDRLAENRGFLIDEFLGRFKAQNSQLRAWLSELEPSGVVNPAVFPALDNFDEALSGVVHDEQLRAAVALMLNDFSAMGDRKTREIIAGQKTGSTGTDSVDIFGYMNMLKDCDASVQWPLFMPDAVERQQEGFHLASIEYKKMPAMRFIGFEGEEYDDVGVRAEKMAVLRAMTEYASDIKYDILFMHHYGLGVDVGPWHGVWGRFMKADAPVPAGFIHFDFTPERALKAGPPYIAQFAYAAFAGDAQALHRREGFDSDAMYDVTRNTMLAQGVIIPYPDKYWTAEVFPEGCENPGTAYMFSAELPD